MFYENVASCECDVIAITETWLNKDVLSSEYITPNFDVYRANTAGRGRGVLLAVKNCYRNKQLSLNSPLPDVDIVAIKMWINSDVNLTIINIYIPPAASIHTYEVIFDYLENEFDITKNVVVMGDFNIPHYYNQCVCSDTGQLSGSCIPLVEFLNYHGLKQNNLVLNNNSRLLDLVLTNEKLPCSVLQCSDPLVPEDLHHPSLHIEIELAIGNAGIPRNTPSIKNLRYNFRRGNYIGLYDAIANKDWSSCFLTDDINKACECFYEELYCLFDTYIPKSRVCNGSYPTWFTASIINSIRLKQSLCKKYKKYKLPIYRQQADNLRKTIKKEICKEYRRFIKSAEANLKNNPKSLWSYINLKKNTGGIPNEMVFEGADLTSPRMIADSFATFFSSVYDTDGDTSFEIVFDKSVVQCCDLNAMHKFAISESDVFSAVKRLKPNFTMGPDDVPAFLIKDCVRCLYEPLLYIYNLIVKSATYPDMWKMAKVFPVFKAGDRNDVSNYRPIAIVSNFSKIFDTILAKNLYSHVSTIISDKQHGFVQARSTATNLCEFVQFVSDGLNTKKQVDVVYTDMSKAFDVVNHSILLNKLSNIGLCECLLNMFRSLLTGRTQYVQCWGIRSYNYYTPSGVIQGSNLGPILFLIYINDVFSKFDCSVFAYADDLKIATYVSSEEDCRKLQNNLDFFNEWCFANKTKLNIGKCKVIKFTKKKITIDYNYNVRGTLLEEVKLIRDLGVVMDAQLSFVPHINYICDHAIKMLGFILRNTTEFCNAESLYILYYAFVRAKLEYCSIVWNPYYKTHIKKLDRIQRRFCKRIYFLEHGSYPVWHMPTKELFLQCNLVPLYVRRTVTSIIYLYKLIHGHINCADLLSQINFRVPRLSNRQLSNRSATFHLTFSRTNQHLYSPINYMCRNYNIIAALVDIFMQNMSIFSKDCTQAVISCIQL